MNVSGTTVNSLARMGYAEVNGYQVSVQYMAAPGSTIDSAAFDNALADLDTRIASLISHSSPI